MENRFYTADEKLSEVTHELLNQGFEELDPCLDNDQELSSHILIDAEKKTFYHTDEECLKTANLVLVEKFQKSHKKITLKNIVKWQN